MRAPDVADDGEAWAQQGKPAMGLFELPFVSGDHAGGGVLAGSKKAPNPLFPPRRGRLRLWTGTQRSYPSPTVGPLVSFRMVGLSPTPSIRDVNVALRTTTQGELPNLQ